MTPTDLIQLQTAVYVIAGGGFIGRFAAEQPGQFYIDDRVDSAYPYYPEEEIYRAVRTLARLAKEAGYDPNNLPRMPHFHNLGVLP